MFRGTRPSPLIEQNKQEIIQEDIVKSSYLRTIMIPVAHKESCHEVLNFALTFVKHGDLVELINVRPELRRPSSETDILEYEQVDVMNHRESHNMLTSCMSYFKNLLIQKDQQLALNVSVRGLVLLIEGIGLRGDLISEISTKIKNVHPDFVILGKHAHQEHLNLGEYLIHNFKLPVILV